MVNQRLQRLITFQNSIQQIRYALELHDRMERLKIYISHVEMSFYFRNLFDRSIQNTNQRMYFKMIFQHFWRIRHRHHKVMIRYFKLVTPKELVVLCAFIQNWTKHYQSCQRLKSDMSLMSAHLTIISSVLISIFPILIN